MGSVEPDVIFRRLAQILGVRPIVYHGEMVVVASRIGSSPSDDREVVVGNFERWPLKDLDVLGQLLRRRVLSDHRAGAEQAAGGDNRQFQEQSIHETDPQVAVPLKASGTSMGVARGPHTCPGLMGSAAAPGMAGRRRCPARTDFASG